MSKARGIHFNAGQVVLASDKLPAGFAYGYAGTAESSASLTNGENNQIYGTHAIAATYLGARAAAGSGTAYTLGEGATSNAHNRYSYAASKPKSSSSRTKSVAFTDRAGTSVSYSGKGNGPAALATANTVAAFSRAEKDPELKQPVVTVGSRDPGKGGAFEQLLM
ncbi:hypothetical protein OEZ85_006463 [Tetradesmus obliquus]|uniref:Uncharacterized protein n=1 Tax=Tetradesmus obliquus TaxID=3088 RepID=A0ABY8TUP9_TETOB|nr:hypothetical protein OEZ85_006463 [Tetradesmus obliquus]